MVQPGATDEGGRSRHRIAVSHIEVCSFTAARPFDGLQMYAHKVDLSNERGETVSADERSAYNGDVFKQLSIHRLGPNQPPRQPEGIITKRRIMPCNWHLSPMAFTILRNKDEGLLSWVLREHPEAVRLADGIHQIREFRTIELDFVTPGGFIHRRYYFSIDHGYAPVRYEWLSVINGAPKVAVDVLALKEVAPGFWFPVKGVTGNVRDGTGNVYEANDVKLNQGLSKKDFDLDFPPGTLVSDEIAGTEYVYEPNVDPGRLLLRVAPVVTVLVVAAVAIALSRRAARNGREEQ
jgi:hypothetical protein